MKKVLAVLALALFLGGISAPVTAATSDHAAQIVLAEEEPKKDTKKAEKSEKSTEKSSDCSSSCEGKKKSDCSKK
jgi:hypothetical protein